MTKLLMSLFISTLAVSSLTASVGAKAFNGETPSIEVKGQASILAVSDHLSLSVAIVERGQFTNKVREVLNSKTNQVIQIAESLSIQSKNVHSSKVSLRVVKGKPSIIIEGIEANRKIGSSSFTKSHQNKLYVNGNAVNNQNARQLKYFELSRIISIQFSNTKVYDRFLSHMIKLNVNRISPSVNAKGKMQAEYQKALTQAFTDAKNKATKLASKANVSLGKLLYVKELSTAPYKSRMSKSIMPDDVVSNHYTEVSHQPIKASVLVRFSIQE